MCRRMTGRLCRYARSPQLQRQPQHDFTACSLTRLQSERITGKMKMDCPHCGKAFHDSWHEVEIQGNPHTSPILVWRTNSKICQACLNSVLNLRKYQLNLPQPGVTLVEEFRVFPINTFRKPTPNEIPPDIKEDYEEACKVLSISNKASAALSRRCLQAILQAQGYCQRDLAVQIDALLNEQDPTKAIPSAVRETVDVIRNFGNFAAHRITDQTTLQI